MRCDLAGAVHAGQRVRHARLIFKPQRETASAQPYTHILPHIHIYDTITVDLRFESTYRAAETEELIRAAFAASRALFLRWHPQKHRRKRSQVRSSSSFVHLSLRFLSLRRWVVEDVGFGTEGRVEVSGVHFWSEPRALQDPRLETRRAELPV